MAHSNSLHTPDSDNAPKRHRKRMMSDAEVITILIFIMNILAAMGAYCFFSTKPHVNFDYEIPPSDGQLVIWQ